MVPGGPGALPGTMDLVRAMEAGPQGVVTVTEMVPGVVPGPGVTIMELDEEKPLHPAGSVQAKVPPDIGGTL